MNLAKQASLWMRLESQIFHELDGALVHRLTRGKKGAARRALGCGCVSDYEAEATGSIGFLAVP
jgi:hypothetical protein